jgi:hypothetical protein
MSIHDESLFNQLCAGCDKPIISHSFPGVCLECALDLPEGQTYEDWKKIPHNFPKCSICGYYHSPNVVHNQGVLK